MEALGKVTLAKQAYIYLPINCITSQTTSNLKPPNFFIEGTSLTGFLEVFHSSLAQSTGKLCLNVLKKILASKFWQARESKGVKSFGTRNDLSCAHLVVPYV